MDLPFILSKSHKSNTKYSWMKRFKLKGDFEEIYQRYIYATHCDLCNVKFRDNYHRRLEHNHETGEFRNIVCNRCNTRKYDRKLNSNNKLNLKYIHHKNEKGYKNGYYRFQLQINGKRKTLKSSVDLQTVIDFRDEWIEDNPEYFT